MKFILGFYKPFAWRVIIALAIMIPTSAVSLLFPWLTGSLVDSIITSGAGSALMALAAIFLGLLICQAILSYAVSVTLATATENVIGHLRTTLFEHIVRLPLAFLTQYRVGELASRLSSDLTQIQETFTVSLVQLFRQGVLLVGALIVIVSTSLPLTIPIVICTPLVVAVAVFLGRKIRKLSMSNQDALATSAAVVDETLQGIMAVKSFEMEHFEAQRYSTAISNTVAYAIKGAKVRALFVTFIIFVVFGGIAGVILYGANLVAEKAISIGELLSFLMYAMFVGGSLGSLAELVGQVQKTIGASIRIQEILQQPVEVLTVPANPSPLPQTHVTAPSSLDPDGIPAIEFRDVGFVYSDRTGHAAVRNLSFTIHSGSRVAFVGESGAGKSTTAALILRLYEPTTGEILYDGTNSRLLSLTNVRSRVGIVPQDVVLLGGTIEDNIRYGRSDASWDEVQDAARQANALGFIETLPGKWQTEVGERGTKLSGGQKQRIAIARALLKNPEILILDEATSSLDATSEQQIQEALDRLMTNRTTIIIAHRLSTVRSCDTIFVFENGTIIEHGSHPELIQHDCSRYKKWADLQFLTG